MRALTFVLTLFFTPVAFAQALLSPSEFRDVGIERIRAIESDVQISVRDDLGIDLRHAGEPPDHTLFLNFDNAYNDYQNAPDRMAEILDRLIRVAMVPPDANPQRERVVSVVRTHDRVAGYRQVYSQMNSEIMARPMGGDLYEVIVFDSAEAVQIASRENLQDLGLSEEEAWRLARANIPARMGEPTVSTFDETPPGVAWVAGGNGLATSALLQPDICVGAPGDLFLVPGRDGYWRASARDGRATTFLRGFAGHLISTGQSESSSLLTCRDAHLVAE